MRSVSGPYVARNNASSAAPVPELRRSLTFLGLLASTMARRITLSLCPMSVYSSSPSVDLASAAARRSHVRASKDRAIARAQGRVWVRRSRELPTHLLRERELDAVARVRANLPRESTIHGGRDGDVR